VQGVVKDSVYMVCSLPATLAGHHVDLMHALAPAIVAFLATHKLDDAHLMDRLADMQPTGRRLMIPPSLLAAVSHDNIRDAVLAARTAFIDGGYHVAPLTHIKLAHVGSMEDWLASRTRMDVELANTAKALDDQIVAVRQRMTAALQEGMGEIERLVKRHKRALCLCMDASLAPSPPN
jgi:predicted transcriptional regulator